MCFCCAIYISLNILQDLVSLVSCYSLTFSVRIRQILTRVEFHLFEFLQQKFVRSLSNLFSFCLCP